MKYSLAKYQVTILAKDSRLHSIFSSLTIGGEGSYVGNISLSRQHNMWETTGYNTGGYVHSKNLSKVGTVSLQLNQLAPQIAKLMYMSEAFFGADYEGFDITVTTNDGVKVASAIDCMIVKVPDQVYEQSAQNQTWSFTCGEVNFGS